MSVVQIATRRPARARAAATHGLSRRGWVAAGVIAVLVVVAVFAPLIAPHNPDDVDILAPFQGFSSGHLLGTDATGRDLLSRLIVGSRTALLGPLLVVGVSTVVGVALAMWGAWRGGLVDVVVARTFDVLFAFPGILLAIVAAAVFGAGLVTAALALSISYIPYVGRIARAEALRQRSLPYIDAAWVQGESGWVVSRRHLLPNLLPIIGAQVTLAFGYATIDVAAISFLGLGVQAPTPDWGTLVAEGQSSIIQGHAQESLFAGVLLVILVLAFTTLGDALTDRQRGRLR
jgi:peptide/nickel transport system permease protein